MLFQQAWLVNGARSFDAASGVPTGISTGIGQSSAVQSLVYSWDGYGNLTGRQDANRSLTESFRYDDLNRLTGSTVSNPAGNGPVLGLSYDAMGNIQTRTLAGSTESYAYDPNHPYAVGSATSGGSTLYSASYDANDPWKSPTGDGNMTSRNGLAIAVPNPHTMRVLRKWLVSRLFTRR